MSAKRLNLSLPSGDKRASMPGRQFAGQCLAQRAIAAATGDHEQIGERESAPRRAQGREPRQAVVRLNQRVRQRAKIEDDLAFREVIELDRAECDFVRPQRRQ